MPQPYQLAFAHMCKYWPSRMDVLWVKREAARRNMYYWQRLIALGTMDAFVAHPFCQKNMSPLQLELLTMSDCLSECVMADVPLTIDH